MIFLKFWVTISSSSVKNNFFPMLNDTFFFLTILSARKINFSLVFCLLLGKSDELFCLSKCLASMCAWCRRLATHESKLLMDKKQTNSWPNNECDLRWLWKKKLYDYFASTKRWNLNLMALPLDICVQRRAEFRKM